MVHTASRLGGLLVLVGMTASLLLTACGGGGGQPLATQPPSATKPAAAPAATAAAPGATAAAPGGAAAAGDPNAGKQAIAKYGCGRCHTIPGIDGANGTVGPNLAGIAKRPQIAGAVPNTPDNLVKWIMNPPGLKPGTQMPNLGVTQPDAQNIAAYLGTLQ